MKRPIFARYETAPALIGAVALSIVFLFSVLSLFSFPAVDDFAYFDQVNQFGFWGAQREWYMHWSGRYTATAVMSIFAELPGGERYYFLGPLSAIALSLMTTFTFFQSVVGRKLPLLTTCVCSLAFWVIYISGLPNIAQSVYWDMGIADYQLANVALLFVLAVAARREFYPSNNYLIIALRFLTAAVITAIAVGSNELTMISVLTILSALLFLAVRLRRDSARFWLAILVIGVVCSFISVLAPGNAVRAASLTSNGLIRPPTWLATIMFVPWVILRATNWLANPALWASAVLLHFATRDQFHQLFFRDGQFQYKWLYFPLAWVVLLFALNGVGFLINHYPLPDRAECVVYFVFLLGCYPTLIILFHWAFKGAPLRASASFVHVVQILLVISLLGSASVYEAVKDLYRGHRYWVEMRGRFEIIKGAVGEGQLNPLVPSVTRLPRTISVAELSTDAGELSNTLMAKYYALKTIRLGPPNNVIGEQHNVMSQPPDVRAVSSDMD
ncbi:hypothetical protein HK44_020775 [Pseudomonas fluorescens HK44]|uniref:Uncharacterized protein n=1 Tax=Pseudomonas fluorescens HK44 TaxID=1042209 RepID=A0A010SU77_PSEFL|nr:DUF6056 family protein [Pseudomonas fluorescens]EXF96295.1 hypothetical protein HK44_020775 [Pseudomonas fluorescens HK44]